MELHRAVNTSERSELNVKKEEYLDWSSKQGRILTCDGKAAKLFTGDRGFVFTDSELPHHYMMHRCNYHVFFNWTDQIKNRRRKSGRDAGVVGAWYRPLFLGCDGFENSTHHDEEVFNVQTPGLFIDLRIPTARALFFAGSDVKSFQDCTDEQLRFLARQHVFGGFSSMEQHEDTGRYVATRHHFIDWNFAGVPRNRPNKWFVDHSPQKHLKGKAWVERSFASGEDGKPYYYERWQRLPGDGGGNGRVVAFMSHPTKSTHRCIIVVVGDRFNYLLQKGDRIPPVGCTSTTAAVDELVGRGKREDAIAYLDAIHGGHGVVCPERGLVVTHPIQPWHRDRVLFTPDESVISLSNRIPQLRGAVLGCPVVLDVMNMEGIGFVSLKQMVRAKNGIANPRSRL